MNAVERSGDPELDLLRFARHARRGATLTLVGALLVVGAFGFSAWQLTMLQGQRDGLQEQIRDLREQAAVAQETSAKATEQVDRVQRQVVSAQRSFILVQEGLRQFFVKDYAGAVKHYEAAISIDPDNPVLYDLRGYSLLRMGKIPQAIESLQTAVRLNPNYVWGHYNLALALAHAGRTQEAVAAVKRVIDIDASFRDTLRRDGQFRILRDEPGFQSLVG